MRKDDIFRLVLDSYRDLAERATASNPTLDEEQRAKQLEIIHDAIRIYEEMYFEEEKPSYEQSRADLRKEWRR